MIAITFGLWVSKYDVCPMRWSKYQFISEQGWAKHWVFEASACFMDDEGGVIILPTLCMGIPLPLPAYFPSSVCRTRSQYEWRRTPFAGSLVVGTNRTTLPIWHSDYTTLILEESWVGRFITFWLKIHNRSLVCSLTIDSLIKDSRSLLFEESSRHYMPYVTKNWNWNEHSLFLFLPSSCGKSAPGLCFWAMLRGSAMPWRGLSNKEMMKMCTCWSKKSNKTELWQICCMIAVRTWKWFSLGASYQTGENDPLYKVWKSARDHLMHEAPHRGRWPWGAIHVWRLHWGRDAGNEP